MSHYLMRKGQKRKYFEMEDEEKKMKRVLERYKESRIQLEGEIIVLNKQIYKLYHYQENNEINLLKLKDLFDKGIIDEEDQPI